jgi:hypothetical protein
MKDRACGGMNVMAAVIAAEGRAAGYAVMFGHPVAFLAEDDTWVMVTLKPP